MLRGINVGGSHRVPMAELRTLLRDHGYADVATYVQSGNVALSSDATVATLQDDVARLIADRFGFAVPVVGRTHEQLTEVVARDPLRDVVTEPRRYQVSFCEEAVGEEVRASLEAALAESERIVFDGREIYAWHPDGIARSKLWNLLASRRLGVSATTRNWATVTTLERMTA